MRPGISLRCAGRANWTTSGCGRSRTFAACRVVWNKLIAAGERVVRVAPHRMRTSHKGERPPGKSDQIDAVAIARAVVKDGAEQFPVAYLDERAMKIRLLSDHRAQLVAERTRVINRLRWHLLVLIPELERQLGRGAFNKLVTVDRVDRKLRKLVGNARAQIVREQLSQLRRLNRQIEVLEARLLELIKACRPQLLAEQGCRPIVAAILIGHTAGVERFRSDASFALLSGTAPIPYSSGKRTQRRLKFSTYAVWWIRRSVLDAIASSNVIRMPAKASQQLAAVRRAEGQLEQIEPRAASDAAIAEHIT
jgi:transposase